MNAAAPEALQQSREVPSEPRRDVTDPLTAELSRLHLTVTRDLLAKVEAARLALSHSHSGATIADILEIGAEAALARETKGKGGPTTVENLRVLCERHNQYAARLAYGDELMSRHRRPRAAST